MKKSSISIWVIYWNARNYPRQFAICEYHVMPDGSVEPEAVNTRGSIEGIRQFLPEGLINLGHCDAADRTIREIWI